MRRLLARVVFVAVAAIHATGAWAACPTGTLLCAAGWCCPPGTGGRTDVCCNKNPQSSGCTSNGSCGSSSGGGSGGGGTGTQCPSGTLRCSAGWCCPPGTGGRTDVCCNSNPQSSGCTSNGNCGSTSTGGGSAAGGGSGTQCPSGTLSCAAGWCCPPGTGGRTDVCCNSNPQSSGCTSNGSCGSGTTSTGGGSGTQCPSGTLHCSAGWCCPPGQGGRTDVCCNNNPQSSGCTTNGSCSAQSTSSAGGGSGSGSGSSSGGGAGSAGSGLQWGCSATGELGLWLALLAFFRRRRVAVAAVCGLAACAPTAELQPAKSAQALSIAATTEAVRSSDVPGDLRPGLDPLSGPAPAVRPATAPSGDAEPGLPEADAPSADQASPCDEGRAP